MLELGSNTSGHFCWVDLAASDAARAKEFYGQLFGWTTHEEFANGGRFTRLGLSGKDVASVYQLKRAHIEQGIESHWTPYIRVDDIDKAAREVAALGGHVIVGPILITGVARIALILDAVGAHVGLWEQIHVRRSP